ncbi:MAG: hypothetical protein ACRCYP_07345 [Alphaproteobacteria bacterium]
MNAYTHTDLLEVLTVSLYPWAVVPRLMRLFVGEADLFQEQKTPAIDITVINFNLG